MTVYQEGEVLRYKLYVSGGENGLVMVEGTRADGYLRRREPE
jgi:hypothetical protein